MGKQLHKRFTKKEIVEIFKRYLTQGLELEASLALLKIKRRQFFKLLREYRNSPDDFSLDYPARRSGRKIPEKMEKKIVEELKKEAGIIKDPNNPVRDYNYSYVKNILEHKHHIVVSLPTIIDRAQKRGFIKKRQPEKLTIGRY